MAAPHRSRLPLLLGVAVVAVIALFVYLWSRPRPHHASPPPEAAQRARPAPRLAPTPPVEPLVPERSRVEPPRPRERHHPGFMPRALRNEGPDKPIRGPLPGEELPPPSVPRTPPETPMIETMDVTPEFRAEKTRLIISHMERRARRLEAEIRRQRAEQSARPEEIRRKEFLLRRLRARTQRLRDSMSDTTADRPAASTPPGATAPDPDDAR